MGMGDISKVDTWREPDGVRVDKLIMRLSHAKCAQGRVGELETKLDEILKQSA